MSTQPVKTHNLRTLHDLLSLEPDEFGRMLPDLRAWYVACRASIALLGGPENFAGASMEWCDDGAPGVLTSMDIVMGDVTVDLMRPETWPYPKAAP